MKGGHDLGGQSGMGPIDPEVESEEPVFHADWERRVFALTLATGMLGKWNIDEARHARERQDPLRYIENSYYENWLEGLEKLLLEKGLLKPDELASRGISSNTDLAVQVPDPQLASKILAAGASSEREPRSEALFQVGERVLVRASEATGHTRAPSYFQGVRGIVSAVIGCHSFPDSSVDGVHEGAILYNVAFQGKDLWGPTSENAEVLVDLWEPYLTAGGN